MTVLSLLWFKTINKWSTLLKLSSLTHTWPLIAELHSFPVKVNICCLVYQQRPLSESKISWRNFFYDPIFRTVSSLGVLSGAQLFSLTKDELQQVCQNDGGRVYSQLMVQKSNLQVSPSWDISLETHSRIPTPSHYFPNPTPPVLILGLLSVRRNLIDVVKLIHFWRWQKMIVRSSGYVREERKVMWTHMDSHQTMCVQVTKTFT